MVCGHLTIVFESTQRASAGKSLHLIWMPELGSQLLNLVYRTKGVAGCTPKHTWLSGIAGFRARTAVLLTRRAVLVIWYWSRESPARPKSKAPGETPRAPRRHSTRMPPPRHERLTAPPPQATENPPPPGARTPREIAPTALKANSAPDPSPVRRSVSPVPRLRSLPYRGLHPGYMSWTAAGSSARRESRDRADSEIRAQLCTARAYCSFVLAPHRHRTKSQRLPPPFPPGARFLRLHPPASKPCCRGRLRSSRTFR